MLVVLPPEEAADNQYRETNGLTRERTRFFNTLWRRAARENPEHIWVLEIDHIAGPDEMADATHYHAGLLQKVAGQIDCWIVDALERDAARTAQAA